MECPTVLKKIVFTSPEAMVEFSGEKSKISALFKNLFNICKLTFVWKVNENTFSPFLIRNHPKTVRKKWNQISYNPGTRPILNHAMFAGNLYSPNVVARYCYLLIYTLPDYLVREYVYVFVWRTRALTHHSIEASMQVFVAANTRKRRRSSSL